MKAMFEVIKYNGDNNTLVYRYPVEDFNTKSQLIVQQSQEAIFYSRGQLADCFPEGTYTLSTKNIPILSGLINLPFGKESPFSAVVYFVNKTEQININWGIGKVGFTEPIHGAHLEAGACGTLTFKVADAKLFLSKLIGQKASFTKEESMKFLQGFIFSHGRNRFANVLNSRADIDILTIDTQLDVLSQALKDALAGDFNEYGLELVQFLVSGVSADKESAAYKNLIEIKNTPLTIVSIQSKNTVRIEETTGDMAVLSIEEKTKQDLAARGVVTDAQAQAAKRQAEGYTYQEERGFDVAEKTAENESAANFSGTAVGIATMGATAGVVGGLYADALSQTAGALTPPQKSTDSSYDVENSFDMCGNVGLEQTEDKGNSNNKVDPEAMLLKLKEWFDAGLIDEEEYKQKKSEILAQLKV